MIYMTLTTMFNQNIKQVANDSDLEKLKMEHNCWDSTYVALSSMITRKKYREQIESAYLESKEYLDNDFIREFKINTIQRWWELYLATLFLRKNYQLGCHLNRGPDFNLEYNKQNIWIEAVSATCGDSNSLDYKQPFFTDDVDEEKLIRKYQTEEIKLRLSNAFISKKEKVDRYLKDKIIKSDEPIIIAINGSKLDAMYDEMLRYLFAIGDQVLKINTANKKSSSNIPIFERQTSIMKNNGAEVVQGVFCNNTSENISAVIYNNDNILENKFNKKIGENLLIISNPFAKNVLPKSFFKFGKKIGWQAKKITKIP